MAHPRHKVSTGGPVEHGGSLGGGEARPTPSTVADDRRLRVRHALNAIDDTLLLLEICRREAIDAAALERVRDDLALVLRRAVDASR
jgi:hypothetical protein